MRYEEGVMTDDRAAHSQRNPRLFELIEHSPKTGTSPTIWAWPQVVEYFRVAGQPVQGPWPPHQEPRPDPTDESLPVAVPDPQSSSPPDVTQQRGEYRH
jgi:hypothetical protein